MSKGKAAPGAKPVKVEICIGTLSVSIEAVGSLDAVAKKALELWRSADSPQFVRNLGFGFTVGESTTVDVLPPPPEITLPTQFIPEEGTDDDQHPR